MKPAPLLLFALFAGFAVFPAAADPAQLPVPPMQGKPWTPPDTKLQPVVVSAIKELFDQGMADPRGCEYRELEFAFGNGDYHEKHHGWLIPGEGDKRYAVGWNGLVYRVAKIGPVVELRKDFDPVTHGLGDFIGNHHGQPIWERTTLSEKSELHIKVAFLLRLGEVELAEGVWFEGTKGDKEMEQGDPYVWMAQTWLTQWHDRVEVEFLQGDYRLAAQTGRALLPVAKMAEAAAARRGIPKRFAGSPYFGADSQLDAIIADSERRAKEPPYVPVLKSGSPSKGPERIAALVRDLELVAVDQHDFPGQPDITEDPIVQALIKEGAPAVEPLIACLEEDPPRFTKTMFTQGTFPTDGPIVPVFETAYIALTAILKTEVTIPLPKGKIPRELNLDERKALAAKFRAYWNARKGKTLQEGWFLTLHDDTAAAGQWAQAAANITERVNITAMPAGLFDSGGGGGEYDPGHPASYPMRGEVLRARSKPSVSDLLVKRCGQLLSVAKTGEEPAPGNPYDEAADRTVTFQKIGKLLVALASWDGKARADDLRTLTKKFDARFVKADNVFYSVLQFDAEIYENRLAAGDPTVFADYADWMSSLTPENYDDHNEIFLLMWQHPSEPAIQKAAEKMFGGADAPWQPKTGHGVISLVNTPMLGFPAFRGRVLKALDDTTVIGYARGYPDGGVATHMNDESPEDPQPGEPPKVDFRLCDYYATFLAKAEGFPPCELYWPQEKRDDAVAVCKTLLKQYGDAFQYDPRRGYDSASDGYDTESAHITFPQLDHPATPQDVARGVAIFSLTGTVRQWAMPGFPLVAILPALKRNPRDAYNDNGGKEKVWQAEEVLVDGKWQRYYGFSGWHQLAKAPAAEVEFPSEYPYVAAAGKIDCKIDGPQLREVDENVETSYFVASPGAPLNVSIKARNHSGIEQQVPGALILPDNAKKTLPPAVSLSLSYSEKIPPAVLNPPAQPGALWGLMYGPPPFDYGAWHELPLRGGIRIASASAPGPLLDAANELTLARLNLRDYFDISKPGSYRLQATFRVPGQPSVKSQEVIFSLVEKTK